MNASDGWFQAAVEAAKASDSEFPVITPHGLRHVAAGLLVQSGANVKVVQRQLGHASAAMTLDVYAALFDDDLDVVGRALGEKISGVVGLSWGGGRLHAV
ncbi:tyrosine-type recombinase/integrase [Corynebacterium ulcerans]|uniref:tyrosine-type recombinase/integrase n=1 Tax=Corynebacterium ulcerans TaxID=65058 RepID=UPI002155511A|nr:tyrosine-type recombinase/integrase [Corynebacterium ulcerans]